MIAGVFLFTVYGLLAWLGARGSAVLAQAADGTAVLSGLCLQFFGPVGALLLAAIFFVACFNVCIGPFVQLRSLFSRKISALFFYSLASGILRWQASLSLF